MVIVSQAYTVSAGRGNVTALPGLNPTETTYAAVLLQLLLLFGWLARARSPPTAQARINERPVARAPLELNYIAFISSLCFYARGTTEGCRQTNEAAPSLLCPAGREVVVWGGGPQGPVCARSVYAAAVDVISEFDSLSALPDLWQISQSE